MIKGKLLPVISKMNLNTAIVENKTIVKNIIERTQDELAQEFLSKYQQNGE